MNTQKKQTKKSAPTTKTGKLRVVKNYYFNADTQKAIVAYQKAETRTEKNKLYYEVIAPAFDKLVENLINIYKIKSESHDELKQDCITFLFETLYKFDATRGTNAFSYFNVVAKHFLIIKNKKYTRNAANISLQDPLISERDHNTIEEYYYVEDPSIESPISKKNIVEILETVQTLASTENELKYVDALINIFEHNERLDILNRYSIALYAREYTGLTQKFIGQAASQIKKCFRKERYKALQEYYDHGAVTNLFG